MHLLINDVSDRSSCLMCVFSNDTFPACQRQCLMRLKMQHSPSFRKMDGSVYVTKVTVK